MARADSVPWVARHNTKAGNYPDHNATTISGDLSGRNAVVAEAQG
jgi:hypothetical protein